MKNPGTWLFFFTLFLLGGWALGPYVPFVALALGAMMIFVGVMNFFFSGSLFFGFMGLLITGLGFFAIQLGLHLNANGWGF